jgi:methylenetetrahydrofolate dehydrogenase (NADP+)/methenyltetrahydrofolate cyclohydrolase
MILIDGKKLQREILEEIKKEVSSLSFVPIFCDVLVGDDHASAQYVRMKAKMAESAGIKFHSASFPSNITTEELVKEIGILNKIENMCGIIVQLPLPQNLDRRVILDAIDPNLDVDCLGTIASDKFYGGSSSLAFPTALACMALIDSLNIDLKDKKIVIIGQGELVGRPLKALLYFRGLEPLTVNKSTESGEKERAFKEADIIISATGKGKLINGGMVKKGVILIDAGTSESNGGIIGDVDLESVKDVASFVSPVPGGVGPVTVAMLLQNVLKVAKMKS